jgi:hypothetical protein
MAPYLLTVYVHIMAAVFLVGYTLFWMIITGSLNQRLDAPESARLLRLINQAHWPPDVIPVPYRVNFPGLGWGALFVLIATGAFVLYSQGMTSQQVISGELFLSPFGWILAAKLILVIALMIFQISLTYQPAPRLIYLNMLVTLLVVILSVLLVH